MDTCKHGKIGDSMLCSGEDAEHDKAMAKMVEADALAAAAPDMAAALDCIVRRLQMDVDDGSRPDQWSMEDLIRTAKTALPEGWVIGAA